MQPNKAVVGRNAFQHESGIHQDGVLKERSTYEIMAAESVGFDETNSIVLGKHSGRHALQSALMDLGYEVSGHTLNQAFKRFKEIADKKKQVTAMDLEALVTDELRADAHAYTLEWFDVEASTRRPPHATVSILTPEGESVRGDFTGDGPIDAIFRAINSAVRREARLREFRIDAVTGGQDALGEASVILELSGASAAGQGVSTDIIEAAALAYVRALSNVERKVVMAAEEPLELTQTPLNITRGARSSVVSSRTALRLEPGLAQQPQPRVAPEQAVAVGLVHAAHRAVGVAQQEDVLGQRPGVGRDRGPSSTRVAVGGSTTLSRSRSPPLRSPAAPARAVLSPTTTEPPALGVARRGDRAAAARVHQVRADRVEARAGPGRSSGPSRRGRAAPSTRSPRRRRSPCAAARAWRPRSGSGTGSASRGRPGTASRFVGLQTPPSTYSRSPISTGANSHGTAQEASTAWATVARGASGAPKITRRPLARSTAAIRRRPSKRAPSASMWSPRSPSVRSGRGDVRSTAARASRPAGAVAAIASGASGVAAARPARAAPRATAPSAVALRGSPGGSIRSGIAAARAHSWAARSPASGRRPAASVAATIEPAEVPSRYSQSRKSSPRPPPARSARRAATPRRACRRRRARARRAGP